jgi:hypothetical protein
MPEAEKSEERSGGKHCGEGTLLHPPIRREFHTFSYTAWSRALSIQK